MSQPHRVVFIPGMFGFGRLAGYDYFRHLRQGVETRYADAGIPVVTDVVTTPPTSSLRYRSRILAKHMAQRADGDGPIHLVGHSTGGLDARLVLSPSNSLQVSPERLRWTSRVVTSISMNTPHYGTPLAGYFSTVAGTRLLYALSLLTVLSLSVGEPSLALFARVLAGLGGIDRAVFHGDLRLISRITDMMLRFVDQGALIQTMPEAMDLFNASTEDNQRVHYGSVASAAPTPHPVRFAKKVRSPYAAFSAAMFATLWGFASQRHNMYPYARPTARQAELLSHGIEPEVTDRTSDGVVPTLSMLWGNLIWCGEADHLDVLGHFPDDARPRQHVDWLASGAPFTRARFGELVDSIVRFQLDPR